MAFNNNNNKSFYGYPSAAQAPVTNNNNSNNSQDKQIFSNLDSALNLDGAGRTSEAFIQYLNCLDLISSQLRQSVASSQQQQISFIPSLDPSKLLNLAKETVNRCEKIQNLHPEIFISSSVSSANYQQQQQLHKAHSLPSMHHPTSPPYSYEPLVPATTTTSSAAAYASAPSYPAPPSLYPSATSSYPTAQAQAMAPQASPMYSSAVGYVDVVSPSAAAVTRQPAVPPRRTPSFSGLSSFTTITHNDVISAMPPNTGSLVPAGNNSNAYSAPSGGALPTSPSTSNNLSSMTSIFAIPLGDRLSSDEQDLLNKMYYSLDLKGDRVLDKDEISQALGPVCYNSGIAELIFYAFDINQSGFVELSDFKYAMAVLTKGTVSERYNFAYRVFDRSGKGYISTNEFYDVLGRCYLFLEQVGFYLDLTASQEKKKLYEIFSGLYNQLDFDKDGRISMQDFQTMMQSQQTHILGGLGVISLPKNYPVRSLPKSGLPVGFGHPSLPKVLNMMIGIRHTHEHMQVLEKIRNQSRMRLMPQDFSMSITFALPPTGIQSSGESAMAQVISFATSTIAKSEEGEQPGSAAVTFTDYAPLVFKDIRKKFGFAEEEYLLSFSPEQLLGNLVLGNLTSLTEKITAGKSGNFFFTTHNGLFLAKTISKSELSTFKKILPEYYQHLQMNPDTLLCRYVGLYKIGNTPFVVMSNAFETNLKIAEVYDLKGSTIGRTNPGEGVKKDLDFTKKDQRIKLGGQRKEKFLSQIQSDAQFLEKHAIIDYSLLLGIYRPTPGTSMIQAVHNSNQSFPITTSKRPFYQVDGGGMVSVDGSELYFVAIIDTLIHYGLRKKAEFHVKSIIHGNEHGVSVTAPDAYASRFISFVTRNVD